MARKFNPHTRQWDETGSASAGTVTSVAGGVGITNTPEPIVGAGTVDLDINSLSTIGAALAAGDLFAVVDVSEGTDPADQRKIAASDVKTFMQGVTSVAGGVGITNTPEPIVGTGTVDLDINSLTTETTLASGDLFPFVDVSVGTTPSSQRKVTLDNFRIGIDDLEDQRYHSWDQYQGGGASGGSTAIVVVGHSAATTTSGASAAFNDATGGYVDLASTAGVADTNATHVGPTDHTITSNNPRFGWVFKTGTDVADIRMYFIYGSATPYASDDPAIHMVGFRGLRTGSVAGVHDTNWQAVTKDGATAVGASDTGVAIATNTRYVFRVVTSGSGTSFDFYINDALVATRSTNLPGTTTALAFFGGLRSRTTTAKSFRFRRNWLRQT